MRETSGYILAYNAIYIYIRFTISKELCLDLTREKTENSFANFI